MDPQELRRPHNMFTAGKLVAELVHSMLSATVREISALQPLQGPSSSLLLAELRAWSLYTCICTDVSPKTPAWCFLKARCYKQAAASCCKLRFSFSALITLLWLPLFRSNCAMDSSRPHSVSDLMLRLLYLLCLSRGNLSLFGTKHSALFKIIAL